MLLIASWAKPKTCRALETTQAHLSDDIGVITPDATAPAYGSLTYFMGGRVISGW